MAYVAPMRRQWRGSRCLRTPTASDDTPNSRTSSWSMARTTQTTWRPLLNLESRGAWDRITSSRPSIQFPQADIAALPNRYYHWLWGHTGPDPGAAPR